MSEVSPTESEQPPAVPSSTDDNRRFRITARGFVRRYWPGLFVLLAIAVIAANRMIDLPYYVIAPGDAVSAKENITVPAERRHDDKGDVVLTTVLLQQGRPLTLGWALLTPGTQIEKTQEVRGTTTAQQFSKYNEMQMVSSQQLATYVALQKAGYDATFTGDGVGVAQVADGSPAVGFLHEGDVIETANDKQLRIARDLVDVVSPTKAGDPVKLHVRNADGVSRDVSIIVRERPAGLGGTGSYIGVAATTKNLRLDTAFPVEFRKTAIGGPSAGLAFTLAIIDEITPGSLTGGKKIAATGTIDETGEVGEVGGIEQKVLAAKREGVAAFLVPKGEESEAKKRAGSLKVIPVATLDDALDALRSEGGDLSGLSRDEAINAGRAA